MKAGIETIIQQCATYLEYQQTQPKEKATPYEVPCRPWEVVGLDILCIKNKDTYVHFRLPQQVSYLKRADSLTADDLVKGAKIAFTEFGLPKKIISDASQNFT